MRTHMMSLAPEWAALTVSGAKTSELRVGGCRFEPGDRALVYGTRGVGAVVGEVFVQRVRKGVRVDDLATAERHRHHVDAGALFAYADGREALTVIDWWPGSAVEYSAPIPLAELRERHGVRPAQTWVTAPPSLIAAADVRRGVVPYPSVIAAACDCCGGDLVAWTTAVRGEACERHADPDGEPQRGCVDCLLRQHAWAAWEGDSAACLNCGRSHTARGDEEYMWWDLDADVPPPTADAVARAERAIEAGRGDPS